MHVFHVAWKGHLQYSRGGVAGVGQGMPSAGLKSIIRLYPVSSYFDYFIPIIILVRKWQGWRWGSGWIKKSLQIKTFAERRYDYVNYVTVIKKLGPITQNSPYIKISSHFSWNDLFLIDFPPPDSSIRTLPKPPSPDCEAPLRNIEKIKTKSQRLSIMYIWGQMYNVIFWVSQKVPFSELFDLGKQNQKLRHPVLVMFLGNLTMSSSHKCLLF